MYPSLECSWHCGALKKHSAVPTASHSHSFAQRTIELDSWSTGRYPSRIACHFFSPGASVAKNAFNSWKSTSCHAYGAGADVTSSSSTAADA